MFSSLKIKFTGGPVSCSTSSIFFEVLRILFKFCFSEAFSCAVASFHAIKSNICSIPISSDIFVPFEDKTSIPPA